MRKNILLWIMSIFSLTLFSFEPRFMYDPCISPDGKTVCFVYLNDLWLVPFEGGEAKRITCTEAYESSPLFSPDGQYIAFNSNREGRNLIYIMPSDGGISQVVSYEEGSLVDWFSDSKSLLVDKSNNASNCFFRFYLNNAKAPEFITEKSDSFASLCSNDTEIIFNRRGDAHRESYKGSHNGELYKYQIKTNKFIKLTNTELTERYPVASVKNPGRTYYTGSDGKVLQIFYTDGNDFSKRTQISKFKEWSARDLSIARQNDRLVYEFFDKIGKVDPANNKCETIKIDIKEDCLNDFTKEMTNYNQMDNYCISADRKLIAFVYKFDLFAVPAEGGAPKQITKNQKGIKSVAILPDNKTILFAQSEKGSYKLSKVNILNPEKIEQIKWADDKNIIGLTLKPDKNIYIYFEHKEDRNQLAIADSLVNQIREVKTVSVNGIFSDIAVQENNDLAYYTSMQDSYNTLNTVNTKDLSGKLIYKTNQYLHSPVLSVNNDYLFFSQNGNLMKFDFASINETALEKDPWDSILKKEEKKTDKKDKPLITPDFSNPETKITFFVNKDGNCTPLFTTKDSLLFYEYEYNGKFSIRKIKFNGKEDSEVTSLNSNPSYYQILPNEKTLWLLMNKNLHKINTETKKDETISFSHPYEYNLLILNQTIFDQLWFEFGNNFYDPNMHGLDWNKAYDKYQEFTKYIYSPQILESLADELIGEVNASHTGFYPRNDKYTKSKNKAMPEFILDYKNRPKEGIKLKKVFRNSVYYKTYQIRDNDILLSVDGITITDTTSIDPLFVNKTGEKIKMVFKKGKDNVEVITKGANWNDFYDAKYDQWVEERRQIVDKETKGEIGYLHIRGMDWESLQKFYTDLYAHNLDKKGLIIDVRGNGGGYIHDNLIEALTKKQYAFSSNREIEKNKKRAFPYQTFEKPIVVLINEDSFSDAEIFPVLFKDLKLGKVIGMPTSGSVIGTGHVYFMDGSSMRMPSNGWYRMDGTNMEGTGAKPDIQVDLSLEDQINDNDLQLKRAIQELYKK